MHASSDNRSNLRNRLWRSSSYLFVLRCCERHLRRVG
jgi:hypothetical protein